MHPCRGATRGHLRVQFYWCAKRTDKTILSVTIGDICAFCLGIGGPAVGSFRKQRRSLQDDLDHVAVAYRVVAADLLAVEAGGGSPDPGSAERRAQVTVDPGGHGRDRGAPLQ